MASSYNSRDLVAEVLVDGDRFRLIRRRQAIDDLLALEKASPWLTTHSHAEAAIAVGMAGI